MTGTYLWMVDDDTVVGRISLRHALTPWLLEVGGHSGTPSGPPPDDAGTPPPLSA